MMNNAFGNRTNQPSVVGLLGGAFDPVHFGHLRIALEALEQLNLSRVLFIPSASPPHKSKHIASNQQRFNLLKIATHSEPRFVVETIEFDRKGYSYTIDTLKLLYNKYPNTLFVWILGADAFSGFTQWKQWMSILDYSHLAIAKRPNTILKRNEQWMQNRWITTAKELTLIPSGQLISINTTQLDISSSKIRQLITMDSEKYSPRYLLPETVWQTIQTQQIYRK